MFRYKFLSVLCFSFCIQTFSNSIPIQILKAPLSCENKELMFGTSNCILAADISNDGKHVVTVDVKKMVCLWNVRTGELEETIGQMDLDLYSLNTKVKFSFDKKHIVVALNCLDFGRYTEGLEGRINIWSLKKTSNFYSRSHVVKQEFFDEIFVHHQDDRSISSQKNIFKNFAISGDGRFLGVVSTYGDVAFIDLNNRKRKRDGKTVSVFSLRGHRRINESFFSHILRNVSQSEFFIKFLPCFYSGFESCVAIVNGTFVKVYAYSSERGTWVCFSNLERCEEIHTDYESHLGSDLFLHLDPDVAVLDVFSLCFDKAGETFKLLHKGKLGYVLRDDFLADSSFCEMVNPLFVDVYDDSSPDSEVSMLDFWDNCFNATYSISFTDVFITIVNYNVVERSDELFSHEIVLLVCLRGKFEFVRILMPRNQRNIAQILKSREHGLRRLCFDKRVEPSSQGDKMEIVSNPSESYDVRLNDGEMVINKVDCDEIDLVETYEFELDGDILVDFDHT